MARQRLDQWWLELLTREPPTFFGFMARVAARVAAMPYGVAVRFRNFLFDSKLRTIAKSNVPVISVGNLTVGGTGKTPCVLWLAKWFGQQKIVPVILSRGYGAANEHQANDEAMELARRLPDVVHLQGANRAIQAGIAEAKHQAEVLILDDGFQHRKLHRDLDLVLIDATNAWGHGYLLPRGLLREAPASLLRADVVILTRSSHVDQTQRMQIRQRVESIAPKALWAEATDAPVAWVDANGRTIGLEEIRGPVAAFCGIGNPIGFSSTLNQLGLEVSDLITFPDHYAYESNDLNRIQEMARQQASEAIICTEKDLVKINCCDVGGIPLWALRIEFQWRLGQPELESELRKLTAEK